MSRGKREDPCESGLVGAQGNHILRVVRPEGGQCPCTAGDGRVRRFEPGGEKIGVNVFEERGDDLARVDYGEILDAVLKAVKKSDTLFMVSKKGTGRLMANVSAAASQVSRKRTLSSPIVGTARDARAVTVNFLDGNGSGGGFHEKIRAIRAELQTALVAAAEEQGRTPEEFVDGLLVPLADLDNGGRPEPGFGYAFPEHKGITRRRLVLQDSGEAGGKSLLSLHRLTVEVDASKFEQNLVGSLENHVEREFSDLEDENEDLYHEIEGLLRHALETDAGREQSGLGRLRELLSEWALGIIKREACGIYLDFLLGGVPAGRPGREHLKRLRDRCLALRDFVDDPARADSEYTVSYGDAQRIDLRELFSQPDAFDPLPVVPQVVGALGEWRDETTGRMRYTYGLKLKLNGAVAKTNDASSLAYHAGVVDPDAEAHGGKLNSGRARDIVRFAVLYAFFFDPDVENARSSHSPLASRLIDVLRSSDMDAKQDELRRVAGLLRSKEVDDQTTELVGLLRWLLEKESVLAAEPRAAHIGVARKVLERDPEIVTANSTFFGEAFSANWRTLLKHVSVGDADKHDWFFSVPLRAEISNPRFKSADDAQETYSMSYETTGMKAMPVFVGLLAKKADLSWRERRVMETYERHVVGQSHPFVLFPYSAEVGRLFRNPNSGETFLYSMVFGLLAYLALETLLSYASGDVYVPILRFQTKDKDDPLPEESYVRSLSKTIAHLLSERPVGGSGDAAGTRASRSQGLVVAGRVNEYVLRNAASSMYAGVPMRFSARSAQGRRGSTAGGLDKFAIVAVSSWESDARKADVPQEGASAERSAQVSPHKLSCAYGEAVTLDRNTDDSVLLRQYGTFSDVYEERRLHCEPDAIQEVIDNLYSDGYKRIAFVARSPFQSRLALTGDDERLFFLSRDTMRFLKRGRDDLYIYPVFFDKYFVVKPGKKGLKANSLYIQDVGDLQRLAGHGRSTIPFLHVFNGVSVGNERFYNGTLAYSAVLGAHRGVLDEQAMLQDLIYDGREGEPNAMKDDIVRYLTLFHFSRFEKSVGGGLGFSLNPLGNLFGGRDGSVGGGSVFPHAGGWPNFNSLAFLSAAKDALTQERSSGRAPRETSAS